MAGRTLTGTVPWDELPLFERIEQADLEKLDPVALLKEFDRDERIFDQEAPSDTLHFIVSGRVKVVKQRPDGNELILEILGAGDPLGVVAALEGFPYPATAVVHEPCKVLLLPRKDFLGFLETHPSLVRGLLAGFCRRNLQLARRLADFPGTVEARIARLFETLATRVGAEVNGQVEIHLALTRQEIADLVGTTLETAIRILSRWGKEGIVLTHKDGFTIPRLSMLHYRGGGG